MAQITYTAKDKTGGDPEKYWKDVDANEVKTVVNNNAVIQFTTSTSTTAYVGTPSPAIASYLDKREYQVKIHATSTGAATLNVSTIGAKKIFTDPTTQASTGDLVIDTIYPMVYDAALDSAAGGFLMVGGGGGTVPDADASTKGIAKLFTSTGSGTDGAMDQNSVSTELAARKLLKRTTVGDADYPILITDSELVTSATLTANRDWTLPTGETAGQPFDCVDEFRAIGAYYITIKVASGKKLNGVTDGTLIMRTKGGHRRFFGDGSGNYSYDEGYGARTRYITTATTVTLDSNREDCITITALATAITFVNPSGTPVDHQLIWFRITDNATPAAINLDTKFRAVGVTLPSITIASTPKYFGALYNLADDKWDVVFVK